MPSVEFGNNKTGTGEGGFADNSDPFEDDLEEAVKHFGQDALHSVVVDADIRIGVHLDQPDAEVLVNHEIEAEEFEGIAPLAGVHGVLGAEEAVEREVLHPEHEVALEVELVVAVLVVEELLEVLE